MKEKTNKKKILTAVLLMLPFLWAGAQSAIVPVGGDAQNATGSVSYTVGQIAVQTESSNGGSVSVAEGVQQAYEIQLPADSAQRQSFPKSNRESVPAQSQRL